MEETQEVVLVQMVVVMEGLIVLALLELLTPEAVAVVEVLEQMVVLALFIYQYQLVLIQEQLQAPQQSLHLEATQL